MTTTIPRPRLVVPAVSLSVSHKAVVKMPGPILKKRESAADNSTEYTEYQKSLDYKLSVVLSIQLTQIQSIPMKSEQPCNFIQSLQIFHKPEQLSDLCTFF